MILELSNDDGGRYVFNTATGSEYILDLNRRTLSRRMAAMPPLVDFLEVPMAQLRRDGDDLELLMLECLEVGRPAKVWLQVRADHIPTLRTTSPVTRIVSLDEVD